MFRQIYNALFTDRDRGMQGGTTNYCMQEVPDRIGIFTILRYTGVSAIIYNISNILGFVEAVLTFFRDSLCFRQNNDHSLIVKLV